MFKKFFSIFAALTLSAGLSAEAPATVEYVDLGLPSGIKWANMNVGATTPEGYGDYFAWGETKPKDYYDWNKYEWCNGSSNTQTKYCTSSFDGTVDNKTVLEPEDDAAAANWKGAWRMPTRAEQDELRTECTWTWTTDYNSTGVAGYIVSSTRNSNTIFLPASGNRINSSLSGVGSHGEYWSSSLEENASYYAYYLNFSYSSDAKWSGGDRYAGRSVRPVYNPAPAATTYTRDNLSNGKFGTICLAYAVDDLEGVGATFYKLNYFDESASALYFEEVDALAAGMPYIFEAKAESFTVNLTITDEPADAGNENGLYGTLDGATMTSDASHSYAAFSNNQVYIAENGYTVTVAANRAYIDMNEVSTTELVHKAPLRAMGVPRGQATNNENVNADGNMNGKFLRNDQLIIVRDGKTYNAQGTLIN